MNHLFVIPTIYDILHVREKENFLKTSLLTIKSSKSSTVLSSHAHLLLLFLAPYLFSFEKLYLTPPIFRRSTFFIIIVNLFENIFQEEKTHKNNRKVLVTISVFLSEVSSREPFFKTSQFCTN